MNIELTPPPGAYSAEEIDDAAVWIARLHAPDRSPNVEEGFRRWLAEKPSHAAAFETVSGAWELAAALKRRPFPKLTRWERAGFRAGFLRSAAAVAAAAAIVAIGSVLYLRTQGITTGVGEQRVLTLEDGSRISLNTASRLVVRYDKRERRVELKAGEALFEVAKQAHRPFVVIAADRQIQAIGTSFIVRQDHLGLSVTLLEGKVAVSSPPLPAQREEDEGSAPISSVIPLTPGQRLIIRSDDGPRIDRPQLENVTAWRRGQVELEDTPLEEAALEMNRYSALKLRVRTPEAAALHINGVFRAGDTAGFAAAVARSYGLTVQHHEGELVIAGVPSREVLTESAK